MQEAAEGREKHMERKSRGAGPAGETETGCSPVPGRQRPHATLPCSPVGLERWPMAESLIVGPRSNQGPAQEADTLLGISTEGTECRDLMMQVMEWLRNWTEEGKDQEGI